MLSLPAPGPFGGLCFLTCNTSWEEKNSTPKTSQKILAGIWLVRDVLHPNHRKLGKTPLSPERIIRLELTPRPSKQRKANNASKYHTSFDAVDENKPKPKEAVQEALRLTFTATTSNTPNATGMPLMLDKPALMDDQTRNAVPVRGGAAVPDHDPGADVVPDAPPSVTPKIVLKGDPPPRSVSSPGVTPDPAPGPRAASCINSGRLPTRGTSAAGPIVCGGER
ncbi:hypothetical protein HPB52_008701 [Rhipicephalus sanguineus]|uniref:Uncharacterized protein n=1 Tax=Rhipicephalus sanguineus TaxID=34632 RepID=A0A9D4PWC6_RHISA|nr:hypothetical protein HPB52_008701 [Rhipicephalus sanguineus]